MRIFYEAWESAFNRQPMADEFNRVDFLPIGFRPAYKLSLIHILLIAINLLVYNVLMI